MTHNVRIFLGSLASLIVVSLTSLLAQAPAGPPLVYGQAFLRSWVPAEYPKAALKDRLSGLVTVRFIVDEKGNVATSRVIEASDPSFVDAAQSAVKKWAFSPAVDANKNVACSMDASIAFMPDEPNGKRTPGTSLPTQDQMPVLSPITEAALSSSANVDYPDSLFDRKLSGRAHYLCNVLSDGSVSNPRITAATHVDFVQPALKALEELKYTPRMQGDIPMEAEVEGILRFDLTPGSSEGALAANKIFAPDGGPPSGQADPVILADPVFPYELLIKGKGGTATVLFTVDKDGLPTNVRMREASDPQLGDALVAAVEMSLFSSPMRNGRTAALDLMRQYDFPVYDQKSDDGPDPVARLLKVDRAGKIGNGVALDAKLVPRYRVSPMYPTALKKNGRPSGQAVIEFVIDRDGRARLPRIVSASDEQFGWAAATAVSQWVFDMPRRNGQPVDVRVKIPFQFKVPTG